MFSLKILNANDTSELTNLMLGRPEIFNGYSDEEHQLYLAKNAAEFLKNDLFFNIGICYDSELIGCLIAKEFQNAPAWCWAHWVSDKQKIGKITKSLQHLSPLKEIFMECDRVLFNEMENIRNLNRFHYAYRADNGGVRGFGSIDRFFKSCINKSEEDSRMSKYSFFNDGFIEPNTMPKYDYQKNMILNRTWPLKIGFRICIRKD